MPVIPPSEQFPRDGSNAEMARQVRGLAIVSIGSCIKRINKLHYKVKSQSKGEESWYDVVKQYGHNLGGRQEGQWTCSCPDFQYRKLVCKHVYAVGFSKELRRRIVQLDVVGPVIQPPVAGLQQPPVECPKCKLGNNVVKDGTRKNKSGAIQKYLCRSCNFRFISNAGFEHSKKNPRIITLALDLYFKGISLRKVADHIKQYHQVRVDGSSVLRWVQRFADEVAPFVDRHLAPPHTGGILHVDEMVVNVRQEKEQHAWLWNMMDDTTRFWITSKISLRREVVDARAVFQDQKEKTGKPRAVIHDGLASYNEAFQREYYTKKNPRVKNIRSISVRNEGLNSRVERLNGTMRDREKVMRGMHSKESAQKIIEAIRINYNYCREHKALGGKTPAQAAGVKFDAPDSGTRIESLIRMAAATDEGKISS